MIVTREAVAMDAAGDDPLVRLAEAAIDSYESITLADGRSIAFNRFGREGGRPVVLCHGWPSTRILGAFFHHAADAADVALICPDRPGIGASSAKRRRRLRDWSTDVESLLDALDMQTVGLLGISGGGPYALAVAHDRPDRVEGIATIASVGPPASLDGRLKWLARMARYTPPLLRLLMWQDHRSLPEDPLDIIADRSARSPEPDAEVWRSDRGLTLAVNGRYATQCGTAPLVQDLATVARPWGFDLDDIDQPVVVVHGERDASVPVACGRYLAERLPAAKSKFLPEEGHLSAAVAVESDVFEKLYIL